MHYAGSNQKNAWVAVSISDTLECMTRILQWLGGSFFHGISSSRGHNMGLPHFVALCFAALCTYMYYVFFTNWRFKTTLWWASLSAPSQQYLLTSCLSHFGTLAIFRDYGICCGGLRSVICDITAVTVSGHHQPHPYKLANAVSNCVCSDCSTDPPFAHLSPSPWTSLPWHTILKVGYW